MSPITVSAISAVIAFLVLAERFYSRFVPDVNAQKRHLKLLAGLALNIGVIAAQIYSLYGLAHTKATLTPGLVMVMALTAGGLVFTLTCMFLIRLIRWNTEETTLLADIAFRHSDALKILSSHPGLSPQLVEQLRTALRGGNPASQKPAEVISLPASEPDARH